MSTRVVASDHAKQAAIQMQQIVNGQLNESLKKLDQLGATLTNPQEWDGRLANEFRTKEWPQVKTTNQQMIKHLEELQRTVQKIVENIMHAGGN